MVAKLSRKGAKTASKKKFPKARAKKKSQKQKLIEHQFSVSLDRMEVLRKVLQFRQFLGSSFEPAISDSEIIVCFADIRAFTSFCRSLQEEMQDRKIQNFLRTYMTIFNEGLMEYFVHNTDPTYGKVDPAIEALSKYVVPTMYKNLGDGMMIVWEIPSALGLAEQGSLAQEIISVVLHTADRFYWHFRNLSPVELDSYSDQVEKLEIGFGVTIRARLAVGFWAFA